MDTLTSRTLKLTQLPIEERNALLDSAFYDVSSLSSEEQSKLTPWVEREGSIIVVPPRGSAEVIRHYKNALRFMNNEGNEIEAIVVAGVGSSVLGTAALARNVADHLGKPVAGIVTGYGVSDLIGEATGGWFFYGMADRLRYSAEIAMENLVTTLAETPPAKRPAGPGVKAFGVSVDSRFVVPGNTDCGTLLDLLIARPKTLRLLVGHSKGSLLIAFVLWHFVDEMGPQSHPLYDELNVVTLGAVVDIPAQFKKRHQFLGELDWFGGMNSLMHVPHTKVSGAWHHLNTQLPYHMSVDAVLREVPAK